MKKAGIILVLFLTFFFCFPSLVFAESQGEIWQDFTELLGEDETLGEEEVIEEAGVGFILSEVVSAILSQKGKIFNFCLLVFSLVLIVCAAESTELFSGSDLSPHVNSGVSAVVSVMLFSALYPFVISVKETLEGLSGFFSGLIPILTGISASSGSVNSAAAHAANMNIIFALVSGVLTAVLLPIAMLMFMLSVSDSLSVGNNTSLAKGIRGLFLWILGIVTAIIMGGVSMQSLISSASDSAYMRAARYASSGLIPVVGSTVSGALGALVGGLSYVKDAVGIGSVAFILTTALAPLFVLLFYRLILSLGVLFMNFVGASAGAFSAIILALDAVIAVFASAILVYVFEMVIFMKYGVASFG